MDTDVEACKPSDFPVLGDVIHLAQKIQIDVRPVEERPDLRVSQCEW
jgi:hypothetical protein